MRSTIDTGHAGRRGGLFRSITGQIRNKAWEIRRYSATVLVIKTSPPVPGDLLPPDSPNRLNVYRSHAFRELELFRGTRASFDEDRFLATFDGPTRAIRAAMAIIDSARRLGLKLQAGLYIGECDVRSNPVQGAAVEFATAISAIAEAHEIVVSSTIKDLVAGSGIQFSEHPSGELHAQPHTSKLFTVLR